MVVRGWVNMEIRLRVGSARAWPGLELRTGREPVQRLVETVQPRRGMWTGGHCRKSLQKRGRFQHTGEWWGGVGQR